VVARARLSEDLTRLEQVEILYKVPRAKAGAQHFGSRLLFLATARCSCPSAMAESPPPRWTERPSATRRRIMLLRSARSSACRRRQAAAE
jgi:hypothetical protein